MKTLDQYIQESEKQSPKSDNVKQLLHDYNSILVPVKKMEDWKFFDATDIFKSSWNLSSPLILTKSDFQSIINSLQFDSIFVFENGVFNAEFSQISTVNLTYTINSSDAISSIDIENNTRNNLHKFEAANLLLSSQGVSIVAHESCIQNIGIITIVSGTNSCSMISNSIVVESKAKLSVTELSVSLSSSNSLINNFSNIVCNNYSECEFTSIQKLDNTCTAVQSIRATQYKNSLCTLNSFPLSGKLVRQNIVVNKQDTQANSHLNGLFFPTNEEHFETYTWVNHNKPECETHELFKGLANGNAQAVFSGMIYVAKDAQKTLATQSNRNMLLSETAKIHSKPQLEIYADDVSCNHGSTTGQINKEALWYMQARGISPQQAVLLLLEGFIAEVVDRISNDSVKQLILDSLKSKI